MVNKTDSNLTGLRFAEEESVGILPASPVWLPLEPNSYGDFGSEITTLARTPITAGRQRKKGVTVDLDASADFETDFTQRGMYELFQGFMFADWRVKAHATITAVAADGAYTIASPVGAFGVGDLVAAFDLAIRSNNGLGKVTAVAGSTVTTNKVTNVDASDGTLRKVGFEFAAGDASIVVTNGVASLETTAKDLTELGLIPGEWVRIGGDAAITQFGTVANNGIARVLSVAEDAIVFDKTKFTMVADSGAGKTIRLFLGDVIKNESDPALIKRRSYQLERTLEKAGAEYVKGSVANEMTLTFSTADKVVVSTAFVSTDSETATAEDGLKAGARPAIKQSDAFNTTSDVGRLRVGNSTGEALIAYFTEVELTINNGVEPNKAIGILGAFDLTAGDFAVSGSLTGYFGNVQAVRAVRANDDATLDFMIVKQNAGWLFDVPLISLGNARLQVEKDQPIMIPLDSEGAESSFGHTLLVMCFHYLPDAAE